MSVTKDDMSKSIKFSFKTEDLFNTVSLRSTYMARNLPGKEDFSNDDFSISDDEKDAFTDCINSTAQDLYALLLKQTSGIDDAVLITDTDVSMSVLDNEAYNLNTLNLVDSRLKESLICGTLKNWYETCALADFAKLYYEKYNKSKQDFHASLFQLKKKRTINKANPGA